MKTLSMRMTNLRQKTRCNQQDHETTNLSNQQDSNNTAANMAKCLQLANRSPLDEEWASRKALDEGMAEDMEASPPRTQTSVQGLAAMTHAANLAEEPQVVAAPAAVAIQWELQCNALQRN